MSPFPAPPAHSPAAAARLVARNCRLDVVIGSGGNAGPEESPFSRNLPFMIQSLGVKASTLDGREGLALASARHTDRSLQLDERALPISNSLRQNREPRCHGFGGKGGNVRVSRQDAKSFAFAAEQPAHRCGMGAFGGAMGTASVRVSRRMPRPSSGRPLTIRSIPSFIRLDPKLSRNPSFSPLSFR